MFDIHPITCEAEAFGPAPAAADTVLCVDRRGRPLTDLRISVIDQCNFRCTYCMPKDVFGPGYSYLKTSERLSFEQIVAMARSFVAVGVDKLRITGGEPLLRKNLERLIEALARLRTPDGRDVEIAMTTNGTLLAAKARSLKDAGLQRVTVSLDALDDAVFKRMNDVGFPVSTVLAGIERAVQIGLAPVKVNTVMQRGVNESQLVPLVRHFRGTGVVQRFIEYMDVGGAGQWALEHVVTAAQARRVIEREFPLVPYPGERGHATASRFLHADGAGEVGFIASVSEPFCGDCSRARVSANGKLFTCLFATDSLDLRPWLDGRHGPGTLSSVLTAHWRKRGDRYSELRSAPAPEGARRYPTVRMSLVGG